MEKMVVQKTEGKQQHQTLLERFPSEVQGTVRPILDNLEGLRIKERMTHELVRSYSPGIAEAHEREVALLEETTINALVKVAKIEKDIQKEKIRAIYYELLDTTSGKIKRIIDGQVERIKLLRAGTSPMRSERVDLNFSSLAKEGINSEAIKRMNGLSVYRVTSAVSEEFVDAQAVLLNSFTISEINPPKLIMDSFAKTHNGVLLEDQLIKGQHQKEYFQEMMFEVKDDTGEFTGKQGKVIAAIIAEFFAGEKTNVVYVPVRGVLPEHRRGSVGTLLEMAVIDEGNRYAAVAEEKLNVFYQAKNGNKAMYRMSEVEYPSLRPSEISETWGRVLFHGRNGASIISPKYLRYMQSDTAYEGKEYNENDYKSVPLSFVIKPIGEREITTPAAIDLIKSIYNIFIVEGLSKPCVESDFRYSAKNLSDIPSTGLEIIHLPRNVDELVNFMERVGDTDSILSKYYSDTLWAKEYLARVEKPVSIAEAKKIFESGSKQTPKDV